MPMIASPSASATALLSDPSREPSGLERPNLARAALHEIYAAAGADMVSVAGIALALAPMGREAPLLWVRQDFLDGEAGVLHAAGLAEFGIDPGRIILVRARDAQAALQAGLEGARCAALGAVMIEIWGAPKVLDLTASRRLALAARESGGFVLLGRGGAEPQPSAAETRWRVKAVPSRVLAANAPGFPAFSLSLLRHRGGFEGGEWHLEWNRDRCSLDMRSSRQNAGAKRDAPLSGGLAAFSAGRPAEPFLRAG